MDDMLFDMEPTYCNKVWRQALSPYWMQFEEKWIIKSNQAHRDPPHQLSRTKTAAPHKIIFYDITMLTIIDVIKLYCGKWPMVFLAAKAVNMRWRRREVCYAIFCYYNTLTPLSVLMTASVINTIYKAFCMARRLSVFLSKLAWFLRTPILISWPNMHISSTSYPPIYLYTTPG